MRHENKSFSREGQAGNAMIYVLIVVVLFAALSFVLSRNTGTSETDIIDEERVKVAASEIIQMSNQVKAGVDQLVFSGTAVADLQFCKNGDICFTSSTYHQVFHPEGGGIVMPKLAAHAILDQADNDPPPGWYLGSFNNVEWTPGAGNDVILAAHQIREDVCRRINEMLFNDPAPKPLVGVAIKNVLIDTDEHGDGNADLDTGSCPLCDGLVTACVSNAAGTMWSFYSVIEQQ